MYWVLIDTTMAKDETNEEEYGLEMDAAVDADALETLTSGDGIFAGGTGLKVPLASTEASETFHGKVKDAAPPPLQDANRTKGKDKGQNPDPHRENPPNIYVHAGKEHGTGR